MTEYLDIIRFSPSIDWYHTPLLKRDIMEFLDDTFGIKHHYIKATDVTLPLGFSRVYGQIVDIDPGLEYPKNMQFLAQLNMEDFAPSDPFGLLPKSGWLYFYRGTDFALREPNRHLGGIWGFEGAILYSNVPRQDLVRTYRSENEGDTMDGRPIVNVRSETESLEDRFDSSGDWDYFARLNVSKIFGYFTSCQRSYQGIKAFSKSKKVIALQIGEDINIEGVLSVLIEMSALKNLKNRKIGKSIVCGEQS